MGCCAARSAFGRRAEPERSEGGLSEEERSGAKWRGRGLGQRNIRIFVKSLQNLLFCWGGGCVFIKKLANNNWVLIHYSDKLREKEVALHILLFFLFYKFCFYTQS